MKKKLVLLCSILLAAALVLSLTACIDARGPAPSPAQNDRPAASETAPANSKDAGEPQATPEMTPEPTPAEAEPEPEPEPEIAEPESEPEISEPEPEESALLPEDGSYTSKEDVALYIHQYGRLPGNFITKKEAQALGWQGGSLERYAPGKCIGGSHFGNYEGLLPEKKGRTYRECDIDTLGARERGAKRIIYSNDGLIYYTEDHYESFELLYGEE